jgi:hypothetical protein
MRSSVVVFGLFLLSFGASAQQLVVTAEGHDGAAPGDVKQSDVSVQLDARPAKVTGWTHLAGDLELYIVIDDGSDTDLGLQFDNLKTFIDSQPAGTKIGLAYLRNGSALIAAPVTAGRDEVIKKLRLPIGMPGIAASPYMGVSDLVKKWPATEARREVLLISSGIDPYSPPDPENPYLQTAIAAAQRAGIAVHSIYYPEAGHLGHSYWRRNWGENYLSELGDATGGEAYWLGLERPVAFEPYLKDFAQRLENQYRLTMDGDDLKSGLHRVKIADSKQGVSLVAAEKVLIPSRHAAS